MSAVTRLPSRPLRVDDVVALDGHDRLDVAPYGGVDDGDGVRIHAIKLAVGNEAHALGFDDTTDEWNRLATVDATDLAAADERLDATLDEWTLDRYGDRFEIVKPM